MTGFSADWLTLREPFDMRARNASVLDAVAVSLATYPSARIVDLACGTGSTLRALSARLPLRQNWNLVDNDLGLLARATATEHSNNVVVTGIPLDLNREAILRDRQCGHSLGQIAKDHGISRATVHRVVHEQPSQERVA